MEITENTPEVHAVPPAHLREIRRLLRHHNAAFNRTDRGVDTYRSLRGSNFVLLTAPHATVHHRGGVPKLRDLGTGPLALALATVTSSSAVVTYGDQSGDANFDLVDPPMRAHARQISSARHVQIDLHGMADRDGLDVCLALGAHPTPRSRALATYAMGVGTQLGLRIQINDPFTADRPTTITSLAQSDGATAIEIEIARHLRYPTATEPDLNVLLTFLYAVIRQAERHV